MGEIDQRFSAGADSAGRGADRVRGSERLELIRLRAVLKDDKATIAELQMQVEFAKKVATWFAKGKQ